MSSSGHRPEELKGQWPRTRVFAGPSEEHEGEQ
jgi:hypothetical protein